MNAEYKSRWDSSRRNRYMEDKAGEAEHSHARQTGDPIAQDLDRLWTELNDEEIGLVDFLLSVAGPETFIANYDEPIFKSLIEKGLLQLPRGVGGNWLRAARTSFRVTPAVRDRIRMDAIRYFGEDDSLRHRRRETAEFMLKSKAVY